MATVGHAAELKSFDQLYIGNYALTQVRDAISEILDHMTLEQFTRAEASREGPAVSSMS